MGFKMDTKRAQAGFRALRDGAADAADDAAREHADEVFEETQRVVPRDTNALANTGRIERNGPGSYSIWYGDSPQDNGPAELPVDYAAAVHEILDHEHAPPTMAKYVEIPLVESIEEFKLRTGKEFRKLVRRSFL